MNKFELFENTLTRLFQNKLRTEPEFGTELWSALANVDWYNTKGEVMEAVGYSFRAAGAVIAEIIGEGDYLDWYCSGDYAQVSDFIQRSMKKEGWICDTMRDICDEPGCLSFAGCGWNDGTRYRNTCMKHWTT
jgi:hypothetical protein